MLTITLITNVMTGEKHSWKAHQGEILRDYFPSKFDPKVGKVEIDGK